MNDAKAKIEIEATASRLPAALRSALGKIRNFGEEVGRVGAGVVKSTALGFVHGVGMAVANRGLDLMIEQGKKVIDFQRELVRFGIAVRKSPAEMQEMGQAARQVSNEVGMDALEVLRAGKAYVDLAGAQSMSIDSMRTLARAAQASGSATTDLAGMMYQLKVSMKIPDSDMEDVIGGLINQAKDGAIEAKQMASEFGAILPLFARFGVTGREGAAQAGAFFQVMRNGANTAAEAGTMMQRVYAGIQSYAPRFEAHGIRIYEKQRDAMGRKVYRPFADIFKDIVKSDAMKDPAIVKKMFGRTEGWRGILLLDEAKRAFGETGDSVDQFVSKLDKLTQAGRETGVVQRDLATYTESSAGRIDVAWERVKNAFAEALTPERIDQIVGGIEQIVAAMPRIVEAIQTAMDAFSGMVHLFRAAGDKFGGGIGNYQPAPDDPSPRTGMTSKRTDLRRAGWKEVINEILATESATGPTDASIEKAVRITHRTGDLTPSQEGGQRAAKAYLEDRGIPSYVIDRVKRNIDKKDNAELSSQAAAVRAAELRDAVKDGVISAMQHPFFRGSMMTPPVMMDGNKVGTALGESSNNRRR